MKYIFIGIIFSASIHARPLNVLFVTDKFPHLSRAYINNQIDGFIEAGVNTYVMARECPPGLENIINKNHPLYNKIFYYDKDNLTSIELDILTKADILYCQFGHIGEEILALKALHNFKGKVVVCFRGADVNKNVDLVFKRADLILPVCEHFKKQLIEYGCPQEKILVHHSAIDFGKYKYKPKENINTKQINIVSIGRLSKRKGFDYLISAINILKNKYKDIKCLIVGDGAERNRLEQKIKSENLNNNVFLKGHVPHNEIPMILEEADLFVLCSCCHLGNQEGIPNVLMEAMAIGIPVVSTFHSGIPELVENNISGFLVPEKDAQALASKIMYIIENQKKLTKTTYKAYKKVFKKHNKSIQNKKILKIFKNLIKGTFYSV